MLAPPESNYQLDFPSKLRALLALNRSDHDDSPLNGPVDRTKKIAEAQSALEFFIGSLRRAVVMMGPEVMHIVQMYESIPDFLSDRPARLQALKTLHDLMLPFCLALKDIAKLVSPEARSPCPFASKVWVLLFESGLADFLVLAKLVMMMMRTDSEKECRLTIVCDDFPDAGFVESHWSVTISSRRGGAHILSGDDEDIAMLDAFADLSSPMEEDTPWEELAAGLEGGELAQDTVQAAGSVAGKKRKSLPPSPTTDTDSSPPNKISKHHKKQSSGDQRGQP